MGAARMVDHGGQYVSRAGAKLAAAMQAFGLDVAGAKCADFGCNVGGFTDCLLAGGAAKVYAIDTGYGQLAWKLRKDRRVVVMERTNALYCPVVEQVDLVAIDVGWTGQALAVSAAGRWLRPGGTIVSLLKPHYEAARLTGKKPYRPLGDEEAKRVCRDVSSGLADCGAAMLAGMISPVRGKGGNLEFLLLLARRTARGGDRRESGHE